MCALRLEKQARYTKPKDFVEQKSSAWDIPPSRSVIEVFYHFQIESTSE